MNQQNLKHIKQRFCDQTGVRFAPAVKYKGVRRAALLCAALVLCAAIALPAMADSVPAAYELLYRVSPATAQYFRSVRMNCEDQGIRMEVISAYAQDDTAQIYFTLQDLTGDRLSKDADLFDSYSIHAPSQVEANGECVDYDSDTRTATFLLTIRQLDSKKIAGDKITFTVKKTLGIRTKGEAAVPADEIARLTVQATQQVPETKLRGWGGTADEEIDPAQLAAALLPQTQPYQIYPGVELTAVGEVDGKARVQLHFTDVKNADQHGYVYWTAEDGKTTDAPVSFDFFIDKELGDAYSEAIFDVPLSQLSACTMNAYYFVSGQVIHGSWEVTFPLENAEK